MLKKICLFLLGYSLYLYLVLTVPSYGFEISMMVFTLCYYK